jgi:hypothetical protein
MPPKPLLPPPPEPKYPALETLIERATAEDLDRFFGDVREALSSLKGAKGEHAKRARAGLEAAEELFGFLLQVREKMTEPEKSVKPKK